MARAKKPKDEAEAKATAKKLLEFNDCWSFCEDKDGKLRVRPKKQDGKVACKRGEAEAADMDRILRAVRKGVVFEE